MIPGSFRNPDLSMNTASQRFNGFDLWRRIEAGFLAAVAGGALFCRADTDIKDINFARDILPILSNNCFVCHGPDAKRQDFLRLDSYQGATSDRGGYSAIDPNSPADSEILKRIHDAEDPMPPAEAEKQLTPAQRELLSKWVLSGGKYARHWALVPPRKTSPPVRDDVSGSIDAFIAEGLQRAGTNFAPEADRGTLARRSSLILTGLPPEPDRVTEFVADPAPDAYDRWIESLLSSPRYGEHQARFWLDAVRYGDTHGLHLDNRRGIFPYRDWVVRAFNDNLPLDRFIVWQLAGDLLPDPTLEQRLATGYIRMNPTTAEGGAIPLEFQAKNNFDRTETLGTVFLGLTLTCARCHTHKYDPITQTEYYRLLAFFNSTSERSLDGNAYVYGPTVKVPRNPGDWEAWKQWNARQTKLIEAATGEEAAPLDALIEYADARVGWQADQWKISPVIDTGASPIGLETWETAEGLPGKLKSQPELAPGKSVWLAFEAQTPKAQTLWLTLAGSRVFRVTVDGMPGDEIRLRARSGYREVVPLELTAGTHDVRLRATGSVPGQALEIGLSSPWDFVAEQKKLPDPTIDRLYLFADRLVPFDAPQGVRQARELLREHAVLNRSLTTSLVAQDLDQPRKTRLLERGEYDRPTGEELTPGVPKAMGPFPEDAPLNRLGLAQWLISDRHPLVARVLVNRIWQRTFGQAIVRTPENFGLQGQYPTHPELLDWLAVELRESGWDLKHMLRLMVKSRTFMQSAQFRESLDDPDNRLFARGPFHRLAAETLRDIGLWSGGALDTHMGGEGIKPYQPSGMWRALSHPASNTKLYVQDQGRRLYRRSIYTYWKRTSPHPMMTLFDAPSRESSCVRRSRTSTPLQSLGLLNETQRVEMGRMLADRLLRERNDDSERLDMLFMLIASRSANPDEHEACGQLLTTAKRHYREREAAAQELLAVGEATATQVSDPIELASWTQLAMTVLASDAAILLY